MDNRPVEVWMRGPIDGVPPLLQPIAHALLQAVEEVELALQGFDDAFLWNRPLDVASVGFHLKHMTGVVDRMFTYAEGTPLTEDQFGYLNAELHSDQNLSGVFLIEAFKSRVLRAIEELKDTDESNLSDVRFLGRKRIPTTLIGLLFHAAEHTQRHVGQLLVTVRLMPTV